MSVRRDAARPVSQADVSAAAVSPIRTSAVVRSTWPWIPSRLLMATSSPAMAVSAAASVDTATGRATSTYARAPGPDHVTPRTSFEWWCASVVAASRMSPTAVRATCSEALSSAANARWMPRVACSASSMVAWRSARAAVVELSVAAAGGRAPGSRLSEDRIELAREHAP